MNGKLQLYKYMRDNGLLKPQHINPEYDKQIEEEEKRGEFFKWKESLSLQDRSQFEYIFGKE